MAEWFKFGKRDSIEKGSKDILVAKFTVDNEETFHMKNMYKMIKDWLDDEGFTDIYGSAGPDNNPEIFYLERVAGNGSKEHRIRWRCLKDPTNSNYYRYFLKIDFSTINMNSIEVMSQGYKMKTDRGDCIIEIEAWLQLDYTNSWKNDSMMRRFDKLFRNRIYKEQIETHKVNLYKLAYRLQNTIKQYLKLRTLYEIPKPFYPEKGI